MCRRRPCPAADPAARDGGLRREEGSSLGVLERDLGRHAGADQAAGGEGLGSAVPLPQPKRKAPKEADEAASAICLNVILRLVF